MLIGSSSTASEEPATVSELFLAALARSFELHGFHTRTQMAAISFEELLDVCRMAQSSVVSDVSRLKFDLVAAMLPDCAKAGLCKHCHVLLDARASPDSRNAVGKTALMLSAHEGHEAVVERLLQVWRE